MTIHFGPGQTIIDLSGVLQFQGTRSTGAAAPWYMASGVTPAIAYQPKGVASLAASYSNLVTPGTYDAYAGTAPGWDSTNGWIFVRASSQYLQTGYTIPDTNTTAFVLYSGFGLTGGGAPFAGHLISPPYYGIQINGATQYYPCNGNYTIVNTPLPTSGVIGIAGPQCYYNGGAVGSPIGGGSGSFGELYIGRASDYTEYATANIQAFVLFASVLNSTQITAIYTAMAAL